MSNFNTVLTKAKARGFSCTSFVDVGANYGDIAKNICEIFPAAKGLMIEPHPSLIEHLTEVTHKQPNLSLLHAGGGASSGTAKFYFGQEDVGYRGSTFNRRHDDPHAVQWFGEEIELTVVTLDELLAKNIIEVPELLKVDVEGAELDVLEGSWQLLGKTEMILLETTLFPSLIEHPTFAEVVTYMAEHGYVLYDLGQMGHRPYDGALMILDTVFVLENSPLRAHPYWA